MTGEAKKQAGISSVLQSDWTASAEACFRRFLVHIGNREFTSDMFRQFAEEDGLPEPHHPNAWGGLLHQQIKEHGLIDTGWRALSTRTAGHRREIKIWRKP
jgi:hypothetical protein|nr:MAG TPA: hypothetical protein [Caudoviricetes sp.]